MTETEPKTPTAPRAASPFSPRRWLFAGMLLLLSVLNYVDRQALAVLATTIQADLGLTNIEYGRVGQAFLFCYAAVYLAAGRLVDRVGPRLAEAGFVVWWSAANVLTGFAGGFGSLLAARGLLGLGEPGHYAVAAKVVGRHFPPAERGMAVSMYTMGGTRGRCRTASRPACAGWPCRCTRWAAPSGRPSPPRWSPG